MKNSLINFTGISNPSYCWIKNTKTPKVCQTALTFQLNNANGRDLTKYQNFLKKHPEFVDKYMPPDTITIETLTNPYLDKDNVWCILNGEIISNSENALEVINYLKELTDKINKTNPEKLRFTKKALSSSENIGSAIKFSEYLNAFLKNDSKFGLLENSELQKHLRKTDYETFEQNPELYIRIGQCIQGLFDIFTEPAIIKGGAKYTQAALKSTEDVFIRNTGS